MFKKIAGSLLVAGFCVSIFAATDARLYAMGQAYCLGDLLVSAYQPWQILGYPDQIMGGADIASLKPGPVVMIKSLGENAAVGVSLNTFDRRTSGSVLFSDFFLRAKYFARFGPEDVSQFPNTPQFNFAYKFSDALKIGLNAFYEFYSPSNNDSLPVSSSTSTKKGAISDAGGCLSARIGFGNLGWNPWIRLGLPLLKVTTTNVTAGTPQVTETITAKNSKNFATRNLLFNVGSCVDYTFGDWGWGIVGAWYRNEQYKFESISNINPTASNFSPKYDASYLDYFIAVTPKIIAEGFLIGFEYQGAYHLIKLEQDLTKSDAYKLDTITKKFFNDFIIPMEMPIKVNRSWLDQFIPRGALRYTIGGMSERSEKADDPTTPTVITVREKWSSLLTKNDEGREGMMLYLGFGLKKGRVRMDFSTQVFDWKSLGMLTGPTPTNFTITLDLH